MAVGLDLSGAHEHDPTRVVLRKLKTARIPSPGGAGRRRSTSQFPDAEKKTNTSARGGNIAAPDQGREEGRGWHPSGARGGRREESRLPEGRVSRGDGARDRERGRMRPGSGESAAERWRTRAKDEDPVEAPDHGSRRRKRMAIDPHDITNKRIDDSTLTTDNIVEKKGELSRNAQFRAIKPSQSILSFVEDNLLGRRRSNELKNAGYNADLSAPLDNIPFSEATERERIEENVFRNKLEFFAAAKVTTSFPPPVIPEIAFAGRSNVGKSSLLNALTRQWGVVRTSDKPGLTQTINFFRLASRLCMVDLPGYGFAYAKEEAIGTWEELVKEYVSTREGLERVCLLIDTKWGMKHRDHELIDLMERSRTPYQIVLTKTDLVFPMDVARRAMQIQEDLKTKKSAIQPVMMVSSKSGAGIRSLRSVLSKLARYIKP